MSNKHKHRHDDDDPAPAPAPAPVVPGTVADDTTDGVPKTDKRDGDAERGRPFST